MLGVVLMLASLARVHATLPACSDLLVGVSEKGGDWTGTLQIKVPELPHGSTFEGWHLRLSFTKTVDTLTHNATSATLSTTVDDKNFIIRNRDSVSGDMLFLKLHALHTGGEKLMLSSVKYNNLHVCNETSISRHRGPQPPCGQLLSGIMELRDEWMAVLTVPAPDNPNAHAHLGWHLKLTFTHPIESLTHNASNTVMTTVDDTNFVLRDWQSEVGRLVLKLEVKLKGPTPRFGLAEVKYNNLLVCTGRSVYNYGEVLGLTLLFLEAQQTGILPPDKRVPWRGDSCTQDRGHQGEDLTGGYFTGTAGRTVKFTFPNAAANTILAWGLMVHEEAYRDAGELFNAMAAVDWGAKYLTKCHAAAGDVYAIVGDQIRETRDFLRRPEEVTYSRPALALSAENPGSDMFGEMVAALASASIVLRNHWGGPQVSALYLHQAKRLFELAAANRGDYLRAMQLITPFQVHVPRNGDECELIWAATWLHYATGEQRYLDIAQKFYRKLNFRERKFTYFYWDDKAVGSMILLYKVTQIEDYAFDARIFCDTVAFNSSLHTKAGVMKGIDKFASGLKLGAWASFACLELGEAMRSFGKAKENPYLDFGLKHIHWALGDTGRSYVVGYGTNPPLRPNDIASLCPPIPKPCNLALFASSTPNYHVLRGALVDGPNNDGYYEDTRQGYFNYVDIVANAGFSSALAALKDLEKQI